MSIAVSYGPGVRFENFQSNFYSTEGEVILELTKRETEEKTYNLGLRYLGRDEEHQCTFILTIDGQTPTLKGQGTIYLYAIKKLVVEPHEEGVIQVTETYEDGRFCNVWFDLEELPVNEAKDAAKDC